jgi:hypothetical protein
LQPAKAISAAEARPAANILFIERRSPSLKPHDVGQFTESLSGLTENCRFASG